jgi:HEAT repeat protein
VPALINAIHRGDPAVYLAVTTLGRMGSKAQDAVPVILRYLREGNVGPWEGTFIEALTSMGPASKAALPDLLKLATNPKEPYSRDAIAGIGRIGEAAATPEAVSALAALLKPSDYGVEAAESLGKMGPAAKAAIPALIDAIRRERDEGRQHPQFDTSFMSTTVGLASIIALGQIGPDAKDALPLLRELLMHVQNMEAKRAIEEAIFKIMGRSDKPLPPVSSDENQKA